MKNAYTQGSAKLAPEQVKHRLSRDVSVILSTCIEHFNEDGSLERDCFDVDAVIAGKGHAEELRYHRTVRPAAWSRPQTALNPYHVARPQRGSFIPLRSRLVG